MTHAAALPSLGFVGIGIMGAPMVRRLLAGGYRVTVWNLEPERADTVVPHGALWAQSPAAVRAASDIVITCVLGDDAVEACCFGQNGFSSASGGASLLIDCSTIDPDHTRNLAKRLKSEAGMDWLDAPISGGPQAAAAGKLTLVAGGNKAVFGRARPVLERLATNFTLMGPIGAGQTTKILNQAIVGVNYVLMAELLALATTTEIDVSALPAALAGGMADSTILQRIFPQMGQRDYDPPRAYARQLDKDLKALEAFRAGKGLDLRVIQQAIACYGDYVASGHAMDDSAAIAVWQGEQAPKKDR